MINRAVGDKIGNSSVTHPWRRVAGGWVVVSRCPPQSAPPGRWYRLLLIQWTGGQQTRLTPADVDSSSQDWRSFCHPLAGSAHLQQNKLLRNIIKAPLHLGWKYTHFHLQTVALLQIEITDIKGAQKSDHVFQFLSLNTTFDEVEVRVYKTEGERICVYEVNLIFHCFNNNFIA